MAVKNLDKKLNALLTKGENTWKTKAKERLANKHWLKHSRRIALKLNFYLRDNNLKQKDLAKLLNVSPQQVSKIIKGKENLTLETISKIERVLNIELLNVDKPSVKEKREMSIHSHTMSYSLPKSNTNEYRLTNTKIFNLQLKMERNSSLQCQ